MCQVEVAGNMCIGMFTSEVLCNVITTCQCENIVVAENMYTDMYTERVDYPLM